VTTDQPVSVEKTVVATDVADTTGTNVTIGETVTYRIRVSLAEGTIPNLLLSDVLPVGQVYVPGTLVVTPGNAGTTTRLCAR
jgi:uncharacterized repeat protein (TIGR01451 family)